MLVPEALADLARAWTIPAEPSGSTIPVPGGKYPRRTTTPRNTVTACPAVTTLRRRPPLPSARRLPILRPAPCGRYLDGKQLTIGGYGQCHVGPTPGHRRRDRLTGQPLCAALCRTPCPRL